MAKSIQVSNGFQDVGVYPNVKQALQAIQEFSGCSLADDVKPHSINRWLRDDGFAYVKNCFDVQFTLDLI